MLKTFKILFFISISFLLFNCKKINEDIPNSKTNDVNWLLEKANNPKINTAKRSQYADLIYDLLKKKKNDSLTRVNYSNLSGIYYSLFQKDKFAKVCKELILKSEIAKDGLMNGTANYNLGTFYYGNYKLDSAYFYYSKSEKIYKKLKKYEYLDYILISKSNIFWLQKDFANSEVYAVKALKIALRNKNNLSIYYCYIALGNSLSGLNKSQKAIEYYRKAQEETNNLKKDLQYLNLKTQPYNYIADVYQKNLEYNKSIAIANEALQFDDFKKKDIAMYCYLTNNISYSKFKLGDKSSLNQFNETLKIGDSIKSIPIQITSKTYLGEYYLAQKDAQKANYYLKQAQKQAHENNIFEDELKILKLLEQANPSKETFYSNSYIELNDSLQNVERATRDKFARIEFETDEITSQKEVVSKENNLLYRRIWIISVFALLSLLIIVLWFKNKSQKAKTRELLLKQEQKVAEEEIFQLMIDQQNKIEEGKNTEKQRISLDLHDNVMGKLAAVRLNLYFELSKEGIEKKESFDNLSKQIQAVEIEIRDIAHNLNTNLFSNNASFVEIVKELFAKIENHSTIKFTLDVSNSVNWDTINNDIKINLYRIIQEALQNIEKYANATSVTISIMQKENQLMLEIADDGKGFNTRTSKEGIGIKNMKTRAIAINGKITIDSKINFGTKINLIVTI